MGEQRKRQRKGENGARLLRIALLAAAVCMMGIGAQTGEVQTMFTKAIYICMECIGLG